MQLATESYTAQAEHWPRSGRHILAQYDDRSIVVYQAYRPEIGRFAAEHGCFGGEFSFSRMSWIKTNFLWMMYRSGWGAKPDQEVTLAVRLHRWAFDALLVQAVHSSFVPEVYASRSEWEQQGAASSVRLQWDPDHSTNGAKLERRALQLGLRAEALQKYARDWILSIEDISDFVSSQRAQAHLPYTELITTKEKVYPVEDANVAKRLGLDQFSPY